MNQTDINWRDINEDESIFEPENKNRIILVQTNVKDSPMSAVTSMAKYVDMLNNRDYSLNENVTFYAFLTWTTQSAQSQTANWKNQFAKTCLHRRKNTAAQKTTAAKKKTKKTCAKNKNSYLTTMNEKTKLWDVQEQVNGEWISIYCAPFEDWSEAKGVFDEALMSQKMMNQDNPVRLIQVKE